MYFFSLLMPANWRTPTSAAAIPERRTAMNDDRPAKSDSAPTAPASPTNEIARAWKLLGYGRLDMTPELIAAARKHPALYCNSAIAECHESGIRLTLIETALDGDALKHEPRFAGLVPYSLAVVLRDLLDEQIIQAATTHLAITAQAQRDATGAVSH